MALYEVAPDTNISTPDLSVIKDIGIGGCRRLCSDTSDCAGFTWFADNNGVCSLKSSIDDKLTFVSPGVSLYVKKKNSNYWLLWAFFVVLIIVIFMAMCKSCRGGKMLRGVSL